MYLPRGCTEKDMNQGFPGGPVAKIPHSQCKGPGSHPWSGNEMPCTTAKSLRVATKDPSCHNKNPAQPNQPFFKKGHRITSGVFPPKVRPPESTRKPDKLKSTFMLQNNRSIRAQNDNIMKDKKILKSFSTIMETQ